MNQEQYDVIHNLRVNNIWDERLLSSSLFRGALNLLTARELFILEERVLGNTYRSIAKILDTSIGGINTRCGKIKRIFETGQRNDSVMSELAFRHDTFYKKLRRQKDAKKEKE